jgi:hypothetical protein
MEKKVKRKRTFLICIISPLKWNREIGNLEIVNGSKIGNIEMES